MFVDDAVPGKFADAVFCIFDGHAGKLSATKCAEEFLQRICDALPEDEKPSTSSGKRKESNNNNNNNNNSHNMRSKEREKENDVSKSRES